MNVTYPYGCKNFGMHAVLVVRIQDQNHRRVRFYVSLSDIVERITMI